MAGPTIHAYREQGEYLRQEELALALAQLQKGESAEQVLQELSYRLTNKLLHPTSIALRHAATAEDPSYFEMLEQDLTEVAQKRRKPKK